MESKKISIIVPVYKVEKYLPKCLDSIINQTYTNLEIILVDDGSPDNCGKICDEYAQKDNRIKVIHKENGGLSAARNTALDIITGDYVGFVDSDDWLDIDMYETLVMYANKYNADIVRCDNYENFEDGKCQYHEKNGDKVNIVDKAQALKDLMYQFESAFVCNKLYKASLFEKQRFELVKNGEDRMLNYSILKSHDMMLVVYVNMPKYHYFFRKDSVTRNLSEEAAIDAFKISEIFYKNEINDKKISSYVCRGYARYNIPIIRDFVLAGQDKNPIVKNMVKEIRKKRKNLKKHIISKREKLSLILICHFWGLYKIYVSMIDVM